MINTFIITLFKIHIIKKIINTLLLLLLSIFTIPAYAIVYVNHNATGLNDGSSWSNAYTELRVALVNTVNDEVWIAAGTYTAAGPNGDTLAHFPMKSGVAIYGGFNGTETVQTQRDPAINKTILSADLNNDDNYNAANGNFNILDNTRNILVADGVDATAILDGVTVYHGNAYGSFPASVGGGMLILNSSPNINNVIFTENFAYSGGAIFSSDSNPTIRNSIFNKNLASRSHGGAIAHMGAIQLLTSLMTIENCQFNDNVAIGSSNRREGGGAIFLDVSNKMIISNSVFNNNKVNHKRGFTGAPLYGGAITAFGDLTVNHSKFTNNQSHVGGAIFLYSTGVFNNVSFINNHAVKERSYGQFFVVRGGLAGALYINGSNLTSVVLSNVTIANNTAQKFAGGLLIEGRWAQPTSISVNNSILWGNRVTTTDVPTTLLEAQFATSNTATSLEVLTSINYSDIQGLSPIDPALMPGAIDSDPQFVDIANNNERLSQASPAIDAGNNCLIIAGTSLDLDANGRRVDDNVTPDSGYGTSPIVDMGAFEFASTPGSLSTRDPLCNDDATDPLIQPIEIAGVIESVGSNYIVVNAVTVYFDANTVIQFEDGTGGALAAGQLVQLVGPENPDGSILATFMEVA
ncbi:MAG: DUF5666 domain-containing protein, partial [Thiohalomonadales bacterium]